MIMQPVFLVSICFGIMILGMSLIPLGFDDEIASERGCDIACMSTPWLVSIGFSVAFSALFSKLWRINRLFGAARFHRIQVRARDVLLPFLILFSINVITLLLLTIIDPLHWVRQPVDGQRWNTVGTCKTDHAVGNVLVGLLLLVNAVALFTACWQAYKARDLSTQFSESKSIGIALYSWLQLMLVGIPIVFLLEDDNVEAKFFLHVALIFAVCSSMLGFLLYPVVRNALGPNDETRSKVRITGLNESSGSASSKQHKQNVQGRCTGAGPYGSKMNQPTSRTLSFTANSSEEGMGNDITPSSTSHTSYSTTESAHTDAEMPSDSIGIRRSVLESIDEGNQNEYSREAPVDVVSSGAATSDPGEEVFEHESCPSSFSPSSHTAFLPPVETITGSKEQEQPVISSPPMTMPDQLVPATTAL